MDLRILGQSLATLLRKNILEPEDAYMSTLSRPILEPSDRVLWNDWQKAPTRYNRWDVYGVTQQLEAQEQQESDLQMQKYNNSFIN